MTVSNAEFYVQSTALDANGNHVLVPAQFLIGSNGQPVVNPNSTLNTVNQLDKQYFNANGTPIINANPNNYLVVPANYSLQSAADFAGTVVEAASNPLLSSTEVMISGFVGVGSQNLQRTYENADGTMTYGGAQVPMFQDAASFNLGVVSQLSGFGAPAAELGGSVYDALAQAGSNLSLSGAWDNNARNMTSISGGAGFIESQAGETSQVLGVTTNNNGQTIVNFVDGSSAVIAATNSTTQSSLSYTILNQDGNIASQVIAHPLLGRSDNSTPLTRETRLDSSCRWTARRLIRLTRKRSSA